jgi:hypothetical protein
LFPLASGSFIALNNNSTHATNGKESHMSKSLINSNLSERSTIRTLLAISLCASMAAFGCTTDRNLGNGDPVTTPGTRSVPTSGTSAGSESEPVPPPMMSSMSSSFSNGAVQPRIARLSADEAAAIMAQQQPRVRVLGPVSPGNGSRPYVSDLMLPRQQREARYTINSTINSQPAEAITSGAGEAVASNDAAVSFLDTSGAAGTSVASATTTTVNTGTNVTNAAAPVIAPSGTAVTPTSNAVSAPTAFASVRTLSPTAASVVNPPASISGSPAVATASSNPVRVLNTNGRLTITNSGTTRQQ